MKKFNKILAKIFQFKKERRRTLSDLPIEEKFKILLELQKIAYPVLKARGIRKKPWMNLAVEIEQLPDFSGRTTERFPTFALGFSTANFALPKKVDVSSRPEFSKERETRV